MAQKSLKKKLNISNKKTEKVFNTNDVGVILENINRRLDIDFKRIDGNIDRLIGGQLKLDQKIDRLDEKLSAKIDALDNRIVLLERRMNSLENRMDSIEQEMRSDFKTIVDFMEAIDLETAEVKKKLATKVDKSEYIIIEQRVLKLELQVNDCQKMIDAAKKS